MQLGSVSAVRRSTSIRLYASNHELRIFCNMLQARTLNSKACITYVQRFYGGGYVWSQVGMCCLSPCCDVQHQC